MTKKILSLIFSLIFLGGFAFVLTWGITNFNKVQEGISGTGVYTEEDINNAYEDGYNTALTNKQEYDELMRIINDKRKKIKNILEENGVPANIATQDVNFVLPRATTSEFVIGFTPEALIHFCHKRLCTRSQEFAQELARKMKVEVKRYSDDFAKELVPQCQHLLWCPEGKRCCGAAPTKQELKEKINNEE